MTELIKDDWAYRGREDVVALDQDDEKEIKNLLLGHRVARIAVDHMELDDGTVIKIVLNQGCGGCTSYCAENAIDLLGLTDAQMNAMIDNLVQEPIS